MREDDKVWECLKRNSWPILFTLKVFLFGKDVIIFIIQEISDLFRGVVYHLPLYLLPPPNLSLLPPLKKYLLPPLKKYHLPSYFFSFLIDLGMDLDMFMDQNLTIWPTTTPTTRRLRRRRTTMTATRMTRCEGRGGGWRQQRQWWQHGEGWRVGGEQHRPDSDQPLHQKQGGGGISAFAHAMQNCASYIESKMTS